MQSSLRASSKIFCVCLPFDFSFLAADFFDFQAGQVERRNGTCLVAACYNSISRIHPTKVDRTEAR